MGTVPLDTGRNLRSLPIQLTPELLIGIQICAPTTFEGYLNLHHFSNASVGNVTGPRSPTPA
jgi:hypothetical protein